MIAIEELSKNTGLSIPFIRKCLNQYRDLFKQYIKRGVNNSLLFDDGGIAFFRKVSQLKHDGFSLPYIANYLKEEQVKIETQTQYNGGANLIQTNENWIEKLLEEKDLRRKEAEEYNQRIIELEKFTSQLQANLKLLPDGKTPEQIRLEWEAEQKKKVEIAHLVQELKTLSVTQFIKKRKILKRLEELTKFQNV